MKKLVSVLALSFAASAFADPSLPTPDRGPWVKFSDDAHEISKILLNPQLAKCVAEFQQSKVIIDRVMRQARAPGITVYGVIGKSPGLGNIDLSINETVTDSESGKTKVYTC